ncbi:DUF6896 domain-containing protein [Dactylosporangium sp. CS-033363]|uniref:DUF6896 domain-containing protein n=1 Tax=Dactylosporangium sp. CS-033363 TaxID=3239935 RepID=UPI003D8D8B98
MLPIVRGAELTDRKGVVAGLEYERHGFGILVVDARGRMVDFDLAADGTAIFDAWRVAQFAGRFADLEAFAAACQDLVEDHVLVEARPGWFSAPPVDPLAASPSAAEADAAWDRIFQRTFGANTYWPALDYLRPRVAGAVPHFVALAESAPHRRATALAAAGRAADPERSFRPSPEARAALRPLAARIVPLLDDPDTEVRAAAVYALHQAEGDPAELWRRLAVETEPEVRAALILALGPAAVSSPVPDGPEAAAAALVRARAGLPIEPGAAAFEVPVDWRRRESTLADLLLATNGGLLDALPPTVRVARAVEDCARWYRSARIWAAPWAGPLLRHDDPAVRAAAVDAIAATGEQAAPWADDLARVAESDAGREKAIWVLGRLGDPRWATLGGWTEWTWPEPSAAQTEAVGRVLAAAIEAGDVECVTTISLRVRFSAAWAAGLVPPLRRARALAPKEVTWTLVCQNAAEAADLPALRLLAADGFAAAAVVCWRMTGDRSVVVAAIRKAIEDWEWSLITHGLTAAAEAGVALPELLETLRDFQRTDDAPAMVHEAKLAAFRVLLAAGEPEDRIRASVRAMMDQDGSSANRAAALVVERGWTDLTGDLLDVLRWTIRPGPAAEALWRLGVPTEDLVPSLLAVVASGIDPVGAVRAMVTIGATATGPHLAELAERDRAIEFGTSSERMAWDDEAVCRTLRAAAAALAALG